MTAGAKARHVRGVVISGRCRDLAEHRQENFPVFARGHSTLGQGGFTRPSVLNQMVMVHPVTIEPGSFPSVDVVPGDIILADIDGVVCVPSRRVDEVVEICAKAREVDAACLTDIRAGLGVQASFKKWRGK
jgi:regulator of RNase E activity RraA